VRGSWPARGDQSWQTRGGEDGRRREILRMEVWRPRHAIHNADAYADICWSVRSADSPPPPILQVGAPM
jgi:hypothetical protein